MSLRIRTIARLTGIREATLRAWERRYGFPRPHRSENNYRVYTRDEVEAIRRVARLMSEGLSVSEAIAQVRNTPVAELPPGERLVERFWSAVMVMDGDEADRVLDEAQAAMDPEVLCDTLLMPALRDMSHRLDIAREHLASALIRQRLRNLVQASQATPGGPRAVVACPERDMPAEALRATCAQVRPDVVALSFVRRREPEEFSQVLTEVVGACAPSPVVVGGPGAREHLKALFSAGAQYAESADELIAIWQQMRNAQNRP